MSHGQELLGRYLRILIQKEQPRVNARPAWLHGMELDFWFQRLNMALEFQGGQHFTPAIYGHDQFIRTRRNDKSKRRLCLERGIMLVRVDAADLFYPRLVRLIRCIGMQAGRRPHRLPIADGEAARLACRSIDIEATEYRKALKAGYGCPTAHRKHSVARKEAFHSLRHNHNR